MSVDTLKNALGAPPGREVDVSAKMEFEVGSNIRSSKDGEGWLDLMVEAKRTLLEIVSNESGVDSAKSYAWRCRWSESEKIVFEIKPKIQLDAILRQLKRYRRLIPSAHILVVSGDFRFAEHILDEGFGFVSFPEAKVYLPQDSREN